MVDSCLPELDELGKSIMWRWEANNPTGCYKEWWTWMNDRGIFEYEPYINEHGESKQRIKKYIPNDIYEYNIVIIDHIALCKIERNFTLKENLDKLSEYAVTCRNLFGMTFIYLQQFNQGLNNSEKQKFKGVLISPCQSDFRDSTTPYADSDIALALMNPMKMDLETCIGYNINKYGELYNLKDRFRMFKVIKNRLSRDDVSIGLLFLPESGSFEELKHVRDLTQQDYDRFNKLVVER
jgi:hypothetical protein